MVLRDPVRAVEGPHHSQRVEVRREPGGSIVVRASQLFGHEVLARGGPIKLSRHQAQLRVWRVAHRMGTSSIRESNPDTAISLGAPRSAQLRATAAAGRRSTISSESLHEASGRAATAPMVSSWVRCGARASAMAAGLSIYAGRAWHAAASFPMGARRARFRSSSTASAEVASIRTSSVLLVAAPRAYGGPVIDYPPAARRHGSRI